MLTSIVTSGWDRARAVFSRLERRLIIPQSCWACGQWQTQPLCDLCLTAWRLCWPRCLRCAAMLSGRMNDAADRLCSRCHVAPLAPWLTITALDYVDPWRRLIIDFKHHDQPGMAKPWARLMADAIHQQRPDAAPWPDVIVPIPMSPQRLKQRGMHHTWHLAQALSIELGIPAQVDIAMRRHDLGPQVGADRERRWQQMQKAFILAPHTSTSLAGQRVAVVDDVITSGATMDALSRTLLRAGVREVEAWTLARTPADDAMTDNPPLGGLTRAQDRFGTP